MEVGTAKVQNAEEVSSNNFFVSCGTLQKHGGANGKKGCLQNVVLENKGFARPYIYGLL